MIYHGQRKHRGNSNVESCVEHIFSVKHCTFRGAIETETITGAIVTNADDDTAMNGEICDYLFLYNPRFNVTGPCVFTVCKNSLLYRLSCDILKNGPTDTDIYTHLVFRKCYYTMCVEDEHNHVHDVAFITIDTKIECRILDNIIAMFNGG